jgi:hypothetical protein
MLKSESIKNISKALSDFLAEIKNPANTARNPFFNSKYAPLNDILNLVRPSLAKHGLSLIQGSAGDGSVVSITTLLMHESGEWIETEPLVLKADKATAQGVGSAITYGRRYSLSAMLGISSEDDDDGNVATHGNTTKQDNKATIQTKSSAINKPDQTKHPDTLDADVFALKTDLNINDDIFSQIKERAGSNNEKILNALKTIKERKTAQSQENKEGKKL